MKKLVFLGSLFIGLCANQAALVNASDYVAPTPKIHYYDLSKQKAINGGWLAYSIVEPRYPAPARVAKLSGCVKVEYTIEADGSVSNALAVKSYPGKVFERSAITSILTKKFVAANKEIKPESVKNTEIVNFILGTPQDADNSKKCSD